MPTNFRGLSYSLPENRYLQVSGDSQIPESPAPSVELGLPDTSTAGEYANVEGLTNRFYDLKNQLESYALKMQRDYGIDVTQPRLDEPGGGLPFQTFNKLTTLFLVTANDLKNSMEIEKADIAAERAGTFMRDPSFDPRSQPASRVPTQQRGFPTRLLPEVMQTNDILRTQVHTKEDHDRARELLNQVIDDINSRTDISPAQKEYNINALVQQFRTTPYAAFQDNDRDKPDRSKLVGEIALTGKIVNLLKRRVDPSKVTPSVDADGNPVTLYSGFNSTAYGEPVEVTVDEGGKEKLKKIQRKIKTTEIRPDGTIQFVFEQPPGIKEEIPPEVISSQTADDVVRNIYVANPRVGTLPRTYAAGVELGVVDPLSGTIVEEAFPSEFEPVEVSNPEVEQAKAEILKKLKNPSFKTRLSPFMQGLASGLGMSFGESTVTFDLPTGQETFVKKNGKWDLKGAKDSVDEFGNPVKGLRDEDIIRRLVGLGYFDKILSGEQQPAEQQPETTSLLGTIPELPPLPGETQGAYDLRLIRFRRQQKKK